MSVTHNHLGNPLADGVNEPSGTQRSVVERCVDTVENGFTMWWVKAKAPTVSRMHPPGDTVAHQHAPTKSAPQSCGEAATYTAPV